MSKTYEPTEQKKSVQVPFPGAALELRNNFKFPGKDKTTGLPTGQMVIAKAGLYLHVAGGRTVDLTGIDPVQLAAAYQQLLKKQLAKELLEEIEATR